MFKKIRGFLNPDKVDRDQGKSLASASSAKELKSSIDGIMHDAKVQRQHREDALEEARQLLVKDVASRLDDPLHIAILNEIFLDGGRASLNVYTLPKKLRQYDNELLRALFGALILLRKERAWGAIVKGKNKSGWWGKANATEKAYGYAEDVLVALCEVGFPPTVTWQHSFWSL